MLGAQYLKHKVFSFERRRREAMLRGGGGPGACSPRKCFEKKCTIWCILGPILAFKVLLFWGFFYCFFNVAFVDKSENKEKEKP